MYLNIETATDLVLQAKTQEAIIYAKHIVEYPFSNAMVNMLTTYQTDMILKELDLRSCELALSN